MQWIPGNFIAGYSAFPHVIQRFQLKNAARRAWKIAAMMPHGKTQNRKRYRNPNVSVREIMQQSPGSEK